MPFADLALKSAAFIVTVPYLQSLRCWHKAAPATKRNRRKSVGMLLQSGGTPASSAGHDRKTALNEADLAESSDVGDWLGVDSGKPVQAMLPLLVHEIDTLLHGKQPCVKVLFVAFCRGLDQVETHEPISFHQSGRDFHISTNTEMHLVALKPCSELDNIQAIYRRERMVGEERSGREGVYFGGKRGRGKLSVSFWNKHA